MLGQATLAGLATLAALVGLAALAAQNSQKEDGTLHPVGPRARPVPRRVLGGPTLKSSHALRSRDEELRTHLWKYCPELADTAGSVTRKRAAAGTLKRFRHDVLHDTPAAAHLVIRLASLRTLL